MSRQILEQWLRTSTAWQSRGRTDRAPGGSVGLSIGEGAPTIGSVHFAWPLDSFGAPAATVRFVDPVFGSNSNNGRTPSTCWATFPYALANGPVGMVLVLRAGIYNDGVSFTSSSDNYTRGYVAYTYGSDGLTIQPYPGEAVWFDGSSLFTGFVASNSYWKASGRTLKRRDLYSWAELSGKSYPPAVNDNNSTNGWGIYDNPTKGWTYVDTGEKTRACAGRPDRVWKRIKGSTDENAWVELTQVSLLSQMLVGDWWYGDAFTNEWYIGVDPNVYDIRTTIHQTLFNSLGTNTTIQGIGFRRYAPSLPQQGFMKFHRSGGIIRYCRFEYISGKCLAVIGSSTNSGANNMLVEYCTFSHIGNCGLAFDKVDYITWRHNRFEYCNDKLFNPAPEAGCVKGTESRYCRGEANVYYMCYRASGVWLDVDNQFVTEVNSDFILCGQRGYIGELSMGFKILGCRFLSLSAEGIVFMDSEDKEVWNCSFYNLGTERGVVNGAEKNGCSAIANFTEQRAPRESARSLSLQNTRDERITGGYITWAGQNPNGYITNKLKVRNCIFGASNYETYWRNQLLGSEASSAPYISRSASLDGMDFRSNVYNGMSAKQVLSRTYPYVLRKISTQPSGSAQNDIYWSVAAVAAATSGYPAGALDLNSLEIYDVDRCNSSTGILATEYQSWGDAIATALPADIAGEMGVTTGLVRMGPLARVE